MTDTTLRHRSVFRKKLVIPAEHGAWSWLLVPCGVGGLIGMQTSVGGQAPGLALLLVLVGGISAYMIRQPATVWLRIRRGRGPRADAPIAAGWALGLAALAALCGLGLLALGRVDLIWLLLPFAGILVAYLAATLAGRARMRALGMELAGAVGLALMAPAAYVAATGQMDAVAWQLWVLMAVQNALGVLYVRLRLADTHQRPASRLQVLAGHMAGLILVSALVATGWIPRLTILPCVGFLFRALWLYARPRPVSNVRRFGFTEVGVEVVGGLLIVIAYWL